ncbi:MAG: ABC transporter permease [Nitriliruptoraceae bacterium]
MNAAATDRAVTGAGPRRDPGSLTGVGTLVRFLLRRDRIKLPAWTGALGLFVVYLTAAFPQIAGTEEELRNASALFNDPVGRMLIGPGYGFDDPTFERFLANGYGLYFALGTALMSILLVVRHTRLEEQTGRAELIRANGVGRSAQLTAAMLVAVITNLVAATIVAGMMIVVGGYTPYGSLVFAVSLAATGLAFAGVTAITAQLSPYSRGAAGLAGAVLGASFLIRAGGDMAADGGTWPSWLSPLAWGQQTAPFVLDRWWPLGLSVAFAAATTGVGYALAARRDLGAGVLTTRPGAREAAPRLGTPLGLAARLQRGNLLGWGAGLAVGGLAYGGYTNAIADAFVDLPEVFLELFGAEDMIAGYLAYIATFMAFLVGAYAIMAITSLRNEETGGRAEPVLATPLSRTVWLGSHLVVVTVGSVVLLAVTGLFTGIAAASVVGDSGLVWDLTLAHLNQAPAVWVVLGVAVALFGVFPRAVPATWALVVYGLIAGTFGPLLDLPELALDLSPFAHPAEIPLEDLALAPLLVLTATAVVLAGVGLLAFRRRDLDLT